MVQAVLSYVIRAIDEASPVMDKVKASVGILGSTLGELGGGFSAVGNIMTGFAGAGALGAVSVGIGELIGGVQQSITTFTGFEEMINRVAASTGASAEEFEMLKNTAVRVSTDMGVSATEAAKALYYMAGGAVDAQQAAALLEPAVRLSQIGMIDLRDASIMTSDIMTQFGLVSDDAAESAESMGHVVDVLATAITSSQTEMWELNEALKYVGPLAKTLGVSFEETIAALGLMADHGIKASIAGTGLKDVLTDLAGPTDKAKTLMEELGINVLDMQGNMLPLADIVDGLNAAFVGMTASQKEAALATIFGKEHVGKLLVLLEEGGDTLRAYAQELRENADSSQMFERQTDSLAKAQDRASAAWEAAQIALGEKLRPVVIAAQEGVAALGLAFASGIDAVSSWLDEVGRIPEVKGFVDAASGAFEGFWRGLQDIGKFIQDTFGPVLQELWSAFKDLWDALSPIGEAFQEILSIFGEGTEGVDLLKAAVMAIAFEIKGFALIIKEIAPYIRQFAEAFKAAVDFIRPVLVQLRDAIGGFIDWLKDAFQGFYDWLVGRSLWMDTWNKILSVAGEMISRLLGDLGSKLFEPIKEAFTGALQSVQDLWDRGWQAVQTTFTTISGQITGGITAFLDSAKTTVSAGVDNIRTNWETGWKAVQTTFNTITTQIQSDLNTRFEEMKAFVTANLGEYAPIANNALTAMQAAMNAVMALIRGDWQGFLANMKTALDSFWAAVQAATSAAFSALQAAFSSSMSALQGIMNGAISAMQSAWGAFTSWLSSSIAAAQSALSSAAASVSSTLSRMQSAASAAASYISNTISSALSNVEASTQDFADKMYRHSIWPEMLAEMQSQTESTLGDIVGDFEGAFDKIGLSVPEFGGYEAPIAPAPTAPFQTSVTVPVQVQIDGATITRTIETRLIRNRRARGGY